VIAAWWHALAPKEQRMLGIGAVFAVLLLGWALVWHPLAARRLALQQSVDNQARDLAYVRLGAAEVEHLRATGMRSRGDRQGKSLLALADATARGAGLGDALKRVEPVGANSVRISLEGASFDAMMGWLETLSRQFGIEASDLSADRAEGLGLVNARATLQDAP
jgi:general secretion pathway protein M